MTGPDAAPDGSSFVGGRAAWLARLGNLRNVTRQELVTRQLTAHLPPPPARVVDVGAGQGTQALRLAAIGHHVVAVEPDASMRAELEATLSEGAPGAGRSVQVVAGGLGSLPAEVTSSAYDVVLCQGVLMYLAESGPALAELAALVAPGGVLSLVFRNAEGMALRPAIRRDWDEVHALLDRADGPNPVYRNEIGVDARADHLSAVEAALAGHGLVTEDWYGVRIATDSADADEPAPSDPVELAAMLAAEERLGRTDPYRRLATLLHLVSRRPAGPPRSATERRS